MSDAEVSKREAAPDPGVERAGRVGRNVALGIYFLALGYVIVLGFWTTIAGVFAQPTADQRELAREGTCEEVRAELAHSLRVASSRYVMDGNRHDHQRLLREFDQRFRGLRARCDDEETRMLDTLRHRVEILLLRFEHENAASFDHLGAGRTPSTSPESPR